MKKILILRGGALGDFLVTLPALQLLRARWPQARIELAGNVAAATLAVADGLLDAIHSQHEMRWSEFHRGKPLSPAFAAWLHDFDLVINFWPDPDDELRRHFPIRPDQVFLTAAAQPARAPAAAHFCDSLRQLGLAAPNYHYRLGGFDPAVRLPRLIAIHPGSGSPEKNWPLDRWTEVCRILAGRPHTGLLIVSGEAEPSGILAKFGTPARCLPLPDLARRLGGCHGFLGHDSGVSHLAAAVGVPSVLLFGPTDARIWAPPAPHVTVLQHAGGLAAISVAEVLAAIPP